MIREILWYDKPEDDWNLQNKRNIKNTPKGSYNCGGYALGLFNWFCPWEEEDDYQIEMCDDTDLQKMVDYMVENLPIRVITTVQELQRNEYAVAFRVGDCDFHYMKRGKNGVWYDKIGSRPQIRCHSEKIVLDTENAWYGRYSGKIILMAMQKRG